LLLLLLPLLPQIDINPLGEDTLLCEDIMHDMPHTCAALLLASTAD
jgi:hypothetical protein